MTRDEFLIAAARGGIQRADRKADLIDSIRRTTCHVMADCVAALFLQGFHIGSVRRMLHTAHLGASYFDVAFRMSDDAYKRATHKITAG